MATESIISLRGFAKIALALLFSVCLCQGARAQTTSSVFAIGPISAVASHPATWGDIWNTAISSKGDLIVYDWKNAGLYQFPADGRLMITLAAPGTAGPGGGFANMGVAIDPWDNLWIGQNWNAELQRIPYDSVNGTWSLSDPNSRFYQYSWNAGGQDFNDALGNWFQAAAFTFGSTVTNGTVTMVISAESSGTLYTASIDAAGNVSNGATIITSMANRARSLAIDNAGNIYYYEDGGPGVMRVPAGVTNLAKDTDASITRVDPFTLDPKDNTVKVYTLTAIDGVSVDAAGNVYISDQKAGVMMVPNENGTPNPSDAVLIASVPAYAGVDFDILRGIMYVPTTPGASGGWTPISGGPIYDDVVAVALSNVNFGSVASNVQGVGQTVNFGFDASVTPASFVIVEDGTTTPDFVIVAGGTCTAKTYAAGATCTVIVAMASHTVGNVSAKLEMLDANGNILASVALSGIGLVPAVVSGPPTALQTHPATWGDVWNTAISSHGDVIVYDWKNAALYQFPADGRPMITLAAPGTAGPGGGFANMGVAIDPWDNLWIGQNWNAELKRIPYDSMNRTWNLSDPNARVYQYSWNAGGQDFNIALGNWFQAGAFTFGSTVTNGTATMVISAESSGTLYTASIDVDGNVSNGTTIITSMANRARSLAIDNAGNIYYYEDGGTGVMRVPAGKTNLAKDTDANITRVDPNLAGPDGVRVDAAGNVYVSDSKTGVYLVPNINGTPISSAAYLLAPVPAYANVDFDVLRGIMYVPTTPGASGGWNGINDIAAVALANVNLGTGAAGSPGTASAVNFGFSAGVTPANFTIEEAGTSTPDFVVASGGTCVAGTAYAALSTCSVNVALDPHAAGGVSGKLLMLDENNKVQASMRLYGLAQGAAISVTPALESSFGAGLNTPSEVAADAAGNSYVADGGLKKVLMYPAGSTASTVGVSVGTGLTAPTGVAVDGVGDVFIADSGSVFEVPNTLAGLDASGQITLKTGLGTKLNLATDGLGNLYVADPDNAQVVKLSNLGGSFGALTQTETLLTGFTAPSVVAVDGSNNLYVVDSPKLIVVQPNGTQTTVLPSLGAATGLAVDASGAVYASLSGGAVRIPFVSGALDPGTETMIGATVTNPTGLALDKADNVYLADGTAMNLHLVSINGAVDTGSPVLGSSGTGTATVTNIGTSTLTVTGFLPSDAVDFSATGCASPVAPLATCVVTVTMDPLGPGVQGPISSAITIQSDAANSPVFVEASGTAAALAASTTKLVIGSTASVNSVPITVTVTSTSGTGPTPTGDVVVSVDGIAQPAATLSNGTYQVALVGIIPGSHTISVAYIGDRVYGVSNDSVTITVAKGTAPMVVPILTQPFYVLSEGGYTDTFVMASYETTFVVKMTAAGGLIPTGTISFMQGTTARCGEKESVPPNSFTLDATGSVTFRPGCLPISTNTNSPNIVTPQTISIVYNGDANYLASTGPALSYLELRQSSVVIAPNPATLSVSGGTGSTKLTVTSLKGYGVSTNLNFPSSNPTLKLNNYTLPLTFSCQGLPAHATCTFSGGNTLDPLTGKMDWMTVNTDPSINQSITVTVVTNVSMGVTTGQTSHPAPFEFAAIFGVGLLGLAFGRKSGRKGRILMLLCLVILAGAIAGTTACSTKILGSNPDKGTPAGTYAVMVTAQQVGSINIPDPAKCPATNPNCVILYGSQNQMSLPFTMNVTVQ